ncbi:ribosome biogenesis regulatory protein [Babesia ovata]|uniref:Multifunctional fusion protein n=1 Tax=Babesia ovata TaxID=189622 RepID=A0A2H6KC71_9APIC|nr:ribosome biogenesis regulatory protein [Babesia ovata]GBE60587.1 ribosome biogenesis regulatory protein [Babesia ovata]
MAHRLLELSRDNTQLLINRIFSLPRISTPDGVFASLPKDDAITMPRMYPLPKPKPKTRWQLFAEARGIKKHKRSRKVFDKTTNDWVPRWGYKSIKKGPAANPPIVEVGDADYAQGVDPFENAKRSKNVQKTRQKLRELRNKSEANALVKTQSTLQRAKLSTRSFGEFDKKSESVGGKPRIKRKVATVSLVEERKTIAAVGSTFTTALAPPRYTTLKTLGRGYANARLATPNAFYCSSHLRRFSSKGSESPKESQPEKEEHNQADQTNHENAGAEDSPVNLEEVEELQIKLEEVTEKLKELQLKYRISLDNCEQIEKIAAKKLHNAKLYAITQFAKDMLDVADAFELAFKSLGTQKDAGLNAEFIEGIRLTESQLHKTFEKHGIKRFESLEQKFNPEVHEAVFEIPEESVDRNTILQVIFNGYTINDRILRAAKVGVSRK